METVKTKSKTSPKNSNRGCKCDDGTYSKDCCNGELQNQGIGSLIEQQSSSITNNNEPRELTFERG